MTDREFIEELEHAEELLPVVRSWLAGRDEPELDTLDHSCWRAESYIGLNSGSDEETLLTRASDVIADILTWAHQNGESVYDVIESARHAHEVELEDLS